MLSQGSVGKDLQNGDVTRWGQAGFSNSFPLHPHSKDGEAVSRRGWGRQQEEDTVAVKGSNYSVP